MSYGYKLGTVTPASQHFRLLSHFPTVVWPLESGALQCSLHHSSHHLCHLLVKEVQWYLETWQMSYKQSRSGQQCGVHGGATVLQH